MPTDARARLHAANAAVQSRSVPEIVAELRKRAEFAVHADVKAALRAMAEWIEAARAAKESK